MTNDVKKSEATARDHLANERTFLAWVRTSIGIMAFGFVVEKFALFLRQVAFFLQQEHFNVPNTSFHLHGSSVLGVLLVGLGTLLCLLAFIKYKRVEQQIEQGGFRPSLLLNVMLLVAVIAIGIFLIIYLGNTLPIP